LRVGHTSTGEESRWVQMVLHCQVKPRWVSNSLKDEIGCQKLLTGVWTELCGYLLSGREDNICADPGVISSDRDIKNVFLNDILDEVYMEQPPGFVAQGECAKVCRLKSHSTV